MISILPEQKAFLSPLLGHYSGRNIRDFEGLEIIHVLDLRPYEPLELVRFRASQFRSGAGSSSPSAKQSCNCDEINGLPLGK